MIHGYQFQVEFLSFENRKVRPFFDGLKTSLPAENDSANLTLWTSLNNRHFDMEKGTIFSILALFRQNHTL